MDSSATEILNGFYMGFNHATQNGPLCEEGMAGVCFVVHSIAPVDLETDAEDVYGHFSGQLISTVKDLCKRALLHA